MPFEKIEKWSGAGGGSPTQTVRVWDATHGSLRFTISADVAGPLGLGVGDRFDLLLGRDKDAGQIALKPSASLTARKLGHVRAASAFTIAAKSLQVSAPEHTTVLPYFVNDGALVIDIRPIMPTALSKAAA